MKDNLQEGFITRVARLLAAGFPLVVLTAVAESLLQEVEFSTAHRTDGLRRKKTVLVPYVHRVARKLENVANRHKVPVAFSALHKLDSLHPKILKGIPKHQFA